MGRGDAASDKRLDASFVDEALRGTEADLLYDVEHVAGDGLECDRHEQ